MRKLLHKEDKLTSYEKGYISAALDADGFLSLSLYKVKLGYTPRCLIGFTNTSVEWLEYIADIIGGRMCVRQQKGYNVWHLQYSHQVIRWLLPQISLVIKEKRRTLLLEALNLVSMKKEKAITFDEYQEELTRVNNLFEKLKRKR